LKSWEAKKGVFPLEAGATGVGWKITLHYPKGIEGKFRGASRVTHEWGIGPGISDPGARLKVHLVLEGRKKGRTRRFEWRHGERSTGEKG